MRESKVLRKLRSGEFVNCIKINIDNPIITEIAAIAGFDCIWVDQEHCSQTSSTLHAQILSTKLHNADIMVRVKRGSYSDYIKPLEMDATGIMVPHIMNLEDAKNVINMTKFHPLGRRPIDGGNADGMYTNMDFAAYITKATEERFVILQIEDPEPIKDLEQIAALPGYDMLFFGPGDFSQGIGAIGDWTNPKITEARKYIADTAKKYGKYAGTTGSIDSLDELKNMGYQFVSVGADVVGLSQYFKNLVASSSTFTNTSFVGNATYK